MTDPFRSPRQRLARAKQKTTELKSATEAFVKIEPYAFVVEHDTASGHDLHKVKMTKVMPDIFTDLAMEVIETLRSCLDQIGYACAVLNGRSNAKSAYFPCSDTGPELANVIKGRCKDLPSEIVSMFRSFQAYKGGNDALWALNKIANTKHTALIPVGHASAGFTASRLIMDAGKGGFAQIPSLVWDSTKNEMIFGVTSGGAQLSYDLNFAFFIAFGECPPFTGRPVAAVLDELGSIVESVLMATEAECRRIGLLHS